MRRKVALAVILVTTAATLRFMAAPLAEETVNLRHLHGLGYSADGNRLKIANHYGIAVYSEGRWSKAPGPAHDYMGFAVTGDFIISSGHPEGSSISRLLGLIRSEDRGKTWTSLGFEGEADFHIVAAGHATNVIYVYTLAPNSRMPVPGIYRRVNETGSGWRHARANGLLGDLNVLAAHPTETGTIAAATTEGLFLSKDSGDAFHHVVHGHVTAACFTFEGDALWFATFADRRARLFRKPLAHAGQQELSMPSLVGVDAVAYIAQNPVRRAEFAIASFQRSVFITPDSADTWRQIARGRGGPPR